MTTQDGGKPPAPRDLIGDGEGHRGQEGKTMAKAPRLRAGGWMGDVCMYVCMYVVCRGR